MTTRSLATSPDAQWAAARIGREISLFAAGAAPATAKIELDSDDVDLALVGPPTALVAVSRGISNKIVLYQPPYLEAVARLDLEIPAKLVTSTGPRVVVMSPDSLHAMVVRAAGRSLATQKLETQGPIEFVVGLERNQLLLGLHRKIEVWDGVSGRPLLRPQFQLPPSPRTLGYAHGHLWALRTGSEEVFIYRLSDGRPFRHHAGAPIRDVVCHPASPLIVIVTERALLRLNCYSHTIHTLSDIPSPPAALAMLAAGDDVVLVGLPAEGDEPWRLVLQGGAPPQAAGDPTDAPQPVSMIASGAVTAATSSTAPGEAPRAVGKTWREQLVLTGVELARGDVAELPVVALDNELGDLGHRLALSASARRALIALYARHLVGDAPMSIAKLAELVGDWPEALGQGDLGQLAMLSTKHGKVRLRRAVTDLLDGQPPRWIRILGSGPTTPRAGMWRATRDGRTNAQIEAALVEDLGRLAVVEGPIAKAMLEARLHGATAVTMTAPVDPPRPWPRDAGLVLVLGGATTAWVADVKPLV